MVALDIVNIINASSQLRLEALLKKIGKTWKGPFKDFHKTKVLKGWDLDEHAGVRQDSLQELIMVCF